MTRSPVELARRAVQAAAEALPPYSGRFSRRDFTQHQLVAILVVMTFLKTDPRGITAMLAEWSDLRRGLGLSKVPHHTTLYKAQQRLLKKVRSRRSWTGSSTRPVTWGLSEIRRRPASTRRVLSGAAARPTTPTARGRSPI